MTNPIAPIAGAMQVGQIAGVGNAASRTSATPSAGFQEALAGGLESVSQLEFAADEAIRDVATGGDTSIHELMSATSKAQLGVELVAQVRDKAIEAYNEIMRMQV